MAKKTSKKASKKPAPKPAKPSKKSPAKKPAPKAKSKSDPMAGVPVKTGSGMTPAQIGAELVSMFNAGKFTEIEDRFWSPKIVSIEGMGTAWHGRKAVEGKNQWWMSEHAVHGASAEGPFVGATGFAVRFRMDVETKATGKRENFDEIGVYTVQNGKIVTEEFMYAAPTP